jgi:rRNA maturation protein Nop10
VTEEKALLCPGCGERATAPHLRENPECMKAAASFAAIYSVSKRRTVGKSTGRPKVLKACPRCGQQVSATEARYGHDGCTVVKNITDNGGQA